ncbi:MAG: hypothetical protein GQ574_15710 [Crocinitomix sp.]|nr:hypothetical protein [Crocinitomix sp.]
MELSAYIGQLLQKHNCVIVPEFGGFIANYKSAVVDAVNNRLSPPSKSVLFNPNLISNDGLLGNYVAQIHAITYPEALNYISNNVVEWNRDLAAGGRVEIGEIGFLFQQDGQVIFEQSREVNLLLNAYGLSGISFVNFAAQPVEKISEKVPVIALEVEKPIIAIPLVAQEKETPIIALEVEKSIEVEIAEESDEKIIPLAPRKRKTFRYLAIAAALPILFYAYWIPMETDFIDTGKIQMADFNPIKQSPQRTYEARTADFEAVEFQETTSWEDLTNNLSDNVNVYNYKFDDELYIPIQLDKTATETPVEEAILSIPVTNETTALPYHVIGGCFSVKSNAENFVADLIEDGYVAKVLDLKGGLYRVTAGDYANRSDAKENLNTFKNNGFSGWILKK